jgi:hypothetical protein
MPAEMNQVSEAALQPGTMLQDRYRIESELGRGGFGAVYHAWDTRLRKACAVKENLEVSPEAQRQFSREATVLADLTHPNLPRVTDHFAIEGKGQYLVMDFVAGEDLATLVQRQGRLPVGQALKWIRQVADALIYLHGRTPPVVHRDIKPANIRITPDDRAVLVDFGLVKLYDPNMRTTMGARAITPGYAPPEQYGRGGSTDVRSDIYALGATLYNLLTGVDPLESVQRIAGKQMPSARQLNPGVDPNISQAIERATALDPDRRFYNAAQFKAALTEPVATMVVEPVRPPQVSADVAAGVASQRRAAPVVAPETAAPKRKTGRLMAGLGAAVVVICLVTGGILASLFLPWDGPVDEQATARVLSVNQTATAISDTLATKTALALEQFTSATAQAAQVAQTATAQSATAQALQFAQTATAEAAQAAQTAQANQAPLDAARQWGLVMEENFVNNSNEWATGEREGSYAKISWTLGNNIYRWDALAYEGFVWWVYPTMDPIGDFYLTADMRTIEAPAQAEVGLMFWHTDENTYYVFEIDNQQHFAVFYFDSSEWTTVWDWTESSAILRGETNRLEIVAQGDHLLFYINNQSVAEVFKAEATNGTAGVVVGLDEQGETGIWEFYRFELRTP